MQRVGGRRRNPLRASRHTRGGDLLGRVQGHRRCDGRDSRSPGISLPDHAAPGGRVDPRAGARAGGGGGGRGGGDARCGTGPGGRVSGRRTPRARSRCSPRGDRVLLRAGLDRWPAGGSGLAIDPRRVPRPDQPQPRRGAVADGSPRTRVHGADGGDQRGDGRLPARVLPAGARRVGCGHERSGGEGRRLAEHERTGAADRDQRPDPGRARDQLHRRCVRRGLPPQRHDPAGAGADAPQTPSASSRTCSTRRRRGSRAGGRSASGRTRGGEPRAGSAGDRDGPRAGARTRCRAH